MADIYPNLPTLLIGNVENKFQLTNAPVLTVVSTPGLAGEPIARDYSIYPPLPSAMDKNPELWLHRVAAALKYQAIEQNTDLWVRELHYKKKNGDAVKLETPLDDLELLLLGHLDFKRLSIRVDK